MLSDSRGVPIIRVLFLDFARFRIDMKTSCDWCAVLLQASDTKCLLIIMTTNSRTWRAMHLMKPFTSYNSLYWKISSSMFRSQLLFVCNHCGTTSFDFLVRCGLTFNREWLFLSVWKIDSLPVVDLEILLRRKVILVLVQLRAWNLIFDFYRIQRKCRVTFLL